MSANTGRNVRGNPVVGPKRPMLRRLLRALGALCRNERGSVAIIVAAAIVPLVGALGLATDTARGYLVKARLSQALDAAALAGGKVYDSVTRDADIQKFFIANFPDGFFDATVSAITIAEGGPAGQETLTLSASAVIDTTFMRVLGFDTMQVSSLAQVTRSMGALDAVISLDMSGSMESPSTKIIAARDSAIELVNTIFGTYDDSPTLTSGGVTYDVLNMGLVTWNGKVRVTIQGQAFDPTLTQSIAVPSFTNPVTGLAQTTLYLANNSPVYLLSNPSTLPGGWSGAVYARYRGDASNTNDGDLVRGQATVGTSAWMGWEPIANYEGEPRSGTWTRAEGGGSSPSWTRWSENSSWRNRSCYNAYVNDSGGTNNQDLASGAIAGSAPNTSRPVAVPNFLSAPAANVYSGAFRFVVPTQSYAAPSFGSPPSSDDCSATLSRGIVPLQSNRTTLTTLLGSITSSDPDGYTSIIQGLNWAWEVLMPGQPFDEAVATVPFPRTRAIILLTDGEHQGSNGDAYKGRFGPGVGAGTTTNAAHGMITVNGASLNNNLNNRLRQLALNVKAEGIKLYVIGFDLAGNATALTLLDEIASDPDENGEYFFNAPTVAALHAAFEQIAVSLSALRLSM